jgi:hypothetical protein
MVAVTVLVDPRKAFTAPDCRSHYEDGVIAVSRTITLIATDPHPSGQREATAGGMVP